MLRVHRAALHGNNNMAVLPFPRDSPLAACLTSLELSSCNMFSLPAQARPDFGLEVAVWPCVCDYIYC